MSLVDYAASDDEEDETMAEAPSATQSARLVLPDAEQELQQGRLSTSSSITATSTAKVEDKSRKRSLENGSSSGPQQKSAHGRLAAARYPPDTAGGRLIPPQLLQRRKNVATEDLGKLFVAKQKARKGEGEV